MYIAKIALENFKGFRGIHEQNFNKGINFFVGNNNCGKSTVFEAIEFIKTKRSKDDVITKGVDGDVSVTIEFKGDVEQAIEQSGLTKYNSYLIDDGNEKCLRIQRSSREDSITQGGKKKELNLSSVRVYNNETKQFENPTGADKTIGALFDTQFVWADTNPNDITDFGSTKICGRLLQRSTGDFFKSEQWSQFQDTHKKTFAEGADSLSEKIKPLAIKLQNIMKEQYGETEVRFSFTLPDVSSFLKTGSISLSDDGLETSSANKGHGMQRALALSLIQIYADISNQVGEKEKKSKPLLFFIDEPETFLHPHAQHKLLDALEKISEGSQIFITTHSPYLLRKFQKTNHALYVFSKNNGNGFEESSSIGLFGASSPTWGEINYYAFNVTSVEFHNELFGFIQAKSISYDENNSKEKNFDLYLNQQGLLQSKQWVRESSGIPKTPYATTLQTYIRNTIHHPENTLNVQYTPEELERSIKEMIPLL